MRSLGITSLALSTLLLASAAAAADFSGDVTQDASLSLRASASGCTNNPGPYITLDGDLRLSGVKLRLILTNNAKFTHVAAADIVSDITLIPEGETIKIAKQPPQGGAGGNPWIYLRFEDGSGNDLGSPELLGRCVQGLKTCNEHFRIPGRALGHASGGGCNNNPGPFITIDGELRLGGINADLILTNNAKFTHVAEKDVVVSVVIIPEGQSITFPKQPPLGGAGGNPWIYVQFLNGSGSPTGSPILLGRCNQL